MAASRCTCRLVLIFLGDKREMCVAGSAKVESTNVDHNQFPLPICEMNEWCHWAWCYTGIVATLRLASEFAKAPVCPDQFPLRLVPLQGWLPQVGFAQIRAARSAQSAKVRPYELPLQICRHGLARTSFSYGATSQVCPTQVGLQ